MELKSKLCEICGNVSTDICWNCLSYYCEACLKFIHNNKLNNQHKSEKIDPHFLIDTKCKIHPTISMNVFCFTEKGKHIYIHI